MSKKKYPGFDEQALQSIARNFPSTAPIDPAHFAPRADSHPNPAPAHNGSEPVRAQAGAPAEPVESAPKQLVAAPQPQPDFAASVNAPANDLAPSPTIPTHGVSERPQKAIRSSKFPAFVSLLALTVAAAPLIAPHLAPYYEKYDAPQWLRNGIEILAGKQSLTALRADTLLAQQRSDSALAEAALSTKIEEARSRLLRLETSGSDLTATAARLDRIDEAVALAHTAQQKAEDITHEFATTLKNSEDSLRASATRTEDRFLAIEMAAREGVQGQLALGQNISALGQNISALGQDISVLRQAMAKLEGFTAGLGETITALDSKTAADRSELATVTTLAAQNVAALKSARDEMQGKIDLLNEQLAKFGDALEAAVAMEIARSSSAINEAIERATLADDRARGLETKLTTYQDNQLRASRMSNVVNRLSAVLLTSEPFMAEISEAKSIFAGVSEAAAPLDTLSTIAPTGALVQSKLRESFVTSVGPQLRDLGVRYDSSLWTRTYTLFSGQNGPTTPEGQRVWDVVAAAEKLLAQGDLANALTQVARFEGPANQIVADWLLQARKRAETDKALARFKAIAAGLQVQ